MSPNTDPRELPENKPPARSIHGLVQGPWHIYIAEVCLVWPQWEKMHLILERLEAPGNGEAILSGDYPLRG